MLKFLAKKRFNHIDGIGLGWFAILVSKEQWVASIILIVAVVIVSVALENRYGE